MDLLFWTQLNPKIIYEPTRKQFYNKYLYRLVINCPGGRLIHDKSGNMHHALKMRIQHHRFLNRGGSWWASQNKELDNASVDQLENLQELFREFESDIKIRIEEPTIQVYSNNKDTLKILANGINDKTQLEAIQFPKNSVQEALLKEGKILTKPSSKIQYKYKVMLRDGNYGANTKIQMLNYLDNLDGDAKVSKGTRDMLQAPFKYLWGCFIYVNDPGVLTFLNIICPNIVLNIHELAVAE
jgi:hypothetical protein